MIRPLAAILAALFLGASPAASQEQPPPFVGKSKIWPKEENRNGLQVPVGWPDAMACREIVTKLHTMRQSPITTEALMLMQAYGAVGCDPRLFLLDLGIKPRQ